MWTCKHTIIILLYLKGKLFFHDDTLMSTIIMIDAFIFNMLFSIMQGYEL